MAEDAYVYDTCTRYGFNVDLPGASCADIYNKNPTSHGRSGYYVLKTDHLFFAYCDMELDCGGNKGGWMRIANFQKRDTYPSGWNSYNSYCTGGSSAGCYSLTFQLTLQDTVRCVEDIRGELWMAFTHQHMHMKKLEITVQRTSQNHWMEYMLQVAKMRG